ncbi:hypothetical protein AAFF_G00132950 [Aldrovandia affinis]|uniref:Cytochrome P450 n=1 Tax=Aldrovandia affinis TaxID=143900 RepID=A0AAD7RQC5_9TELE|nr:hypothetical protein AAFF_G00132950 [Aldrovandia affinis]
MALQVLLRSVLEWTDVQSLLLFLLVFLLISDHFRRRNPKNFPPGPWALPFLGNVFHLDTKQPHIHFNELVKCYGNVFSLHLGGVNTVVVNGYSLVKEALINQGSTFADRPDCPLNRRINNCQGIAFNNGYSWKQATAGNSRFTVSTLRDFGVGKRSLESQILEEIKFLHQAVLEKSVCAFLREEIENHQKDWDPSAPRDFIDCYLSEIEKRRDDPEAGFHEEGLCYCMLDLFVAGTETTSTTLLWAFIYMMKYPEIQGR